nr:MAG TPA: hypothetical protein [Caudoviricetes sp.]
MRFHCRAVHAHAVPSLYLFSSPLKLFVFCLNVLIVAADYIAFGVQLIPHQAAFPTVAPLADAGEAAIIEPFTDSLFVIVAEADNREFTGRACRDFLTHSEADTFALRRLSAKRTLALSDRTIKEQRNRARLWEDQLVDFLLVRLDLLADRTLHLPQAAASVLEKALDLVIVEERCAIIQTRENGHGFFCNCVSADGCNLVFDSCRVRGLAADELAVDIRVGRACAENRLCERDFDLDLFHSVLYSFSVSDGEPPSWGGWLSVFLASTRLACSVFLNFRRKKIVMDRSARNSKDVTNRNNLILCELAMIVNFLAKRTFTDFTSGCNIRICHSLLYNPASEF